MPSEETAVETTADCPTTPGRPFQVGMTRSSITIMFLPPEYANGSSVQTYEVRRFAPEPPRSEEDLIKRDKRGKQTFKERRDKFFPELGPSTRYSIKGHENFIQVKFPSLYPSARFLVRARNEIGWSQFSELSPVMHSGDSIRVTNVGSTFIDMEWDMPPGVKIHRFEVQNRAYTLLLLEEQFHRALGGVVTPRTDGKPVKFTLRGLRPGARQQVRVRSSDETEGWRPWKTAM